jgi:hypothetical protein
LFVDFQNSASGANFDAGPFTFSKEKIDDLPRALATKQLPELLLVKIDLVFLNEPDEVVGVCNARAPI